MCLFLFGVYVVTELLACAEDEIDKRSANNVSFDFSDWGLSLEDNGRHDIGLNSFFIDVSIDQKSIPDFL